MTDATELDEAAIRARLEAARPGLPAAVARVAINRDGTCDGCAQSKRLVASYPEPDAEPWLCAECAADVDFVMFAPLDIGLLLTALDEARAEVQRERSALGQWRRLAHERLARAEAAEGALAAVKALHQPRECRVMVARWEPETYIGTEAGAWCDTCKARYPCPTSAALATPTTTEGGE